MIAKRMSRPLTGSVAIGFASMLVALFLMEITLRALALPSPQSSGLLFGLPLPPHRISVARPRKDKSKIYPGLVVDGAEITRGDLGSINRSDPVLGYTPQENASSTNGWWTSNNIGARRTEPTTPEVAPGRCRLLVFGESFGQSARVKNHQAWTHQLEELHPKLEVINLAVGGYSMAQAHLRYLSIAPTLQADGSIMMFVPQADLWRDVNTIRNLFSNWNLPEVMPRYAIENGELTLIPSPYRDSADFYADNSDGTTPRLRNHLRRFDRFYFTPLYETPPFIGHLYIYKLAALAVGRSAKLALEKSLRSFDLRSEAMAVSRAIFRTMAEQEAKRGRTFTLILVPLNRDIRRGPNRQWSAMTEFICSDIDRCVDLLPTLHSRANDLDKGYDGTHFGPRTNKLIASTLAAKLGFRGGSGASAACLSPQQ